MHSFDIFTGAVVRQVEAAVRDVRSSVIPA
jgi:hypothetical protein